MTKKKLREENRRLLQEVNELLKKYKQLQDKHSITEQACINYERQCETLFDLLREMKAKYADELQKRIELAEIIRQREEE